MRECLNIVKKKYISFLLINCLSNYDDSDKFMNYLTNCILLISFFFFKYELFFLLLIEFVAGVDRRK